MGDDERCKGDSAVIRFKATAWANVELECSIESFDKLFQWSKESRFFVEILKSDDLAVFNAWKFFGALCVKEVNAVWVGRISVRDECNLLLWFGSSGSFTHGDDGILGVA